MLKFTNNTKTFSSIKEKQEWINNTELVTLFKGNIIRFDRSSGKYWALYSNSIIEINKSDIKACNIDTKKFKKIG